MIRRIHFFSYLGFDLKMMKAARGQFCLLIGGEWSQHSPFCFLFYSFLFIRAEFYGYELFDIL